MKRILLSIFLFSTFANLHAQEVISSYGGTLSNANGSVEFTVGELVINSLVNPSNTLTQGFHQPSLATLSVDEFEKLNIKIYPNPAKDFINIKLLNFNSLNYSLFDMQGRMIYDDTIKNRFTALNVENLAHGVYILRVRNDQNDKQKSYRIIKN